MTIAAVSAVVRAHRFGYASEDDLQEGVARALRGHGYAVRREVALDAHCRIDLLVGDTIGVEVKTAGSAADAARQLERYLATGKLEGLVLVTARVVHLRVERILGDPRVAVVALPLAGNSP